MTSAIGLNMPDSVPVIGRPGNINVNTGVSIGIVIVLVGGFAVLIKGQNDNRQATADMKSELSMQALATKAELSADIKDLKNRMTNLESSKNNWSAVDMFKWSVHLQQLNSDPKRLETQGLKVPEPETR